MGALCCATRGFVIEPPTSSQANIAENATDDKMKNSQQRDIAEQDRLGVQSVASLQHANTELRAQLTAAEAKALELAKELQQAQSQATVERFKLQKRLDEAYAKLLENQQATRQPDGREAIKHGNHQEQADNWQPHVLHAIRAANPDSKLPALWSLPDCKRWEGIRIEGHTITGLALSGALITTLPEEIGDLVALTALMLSNNRLQSLPPSVGKLRNLACLLLDGNNLSELPDEVTELTQLQTLWLQDNKLEALPSSLGRMVNMRHLLCSNNCLTSVPDSLKNMASLTSLWLDSNKLTSLPVGIAEITSLRRLRVDTPLLESLPADLTRVTACDHNSSSGGSHNSSK